jgi:nitrilase
MRHIAYEGRCFVLSACQRLTREDWPVDLRETGGVIDGRSLIVSPQGSVVGVTEVTGLLVAEIDMDEIARGKFDLDVAGHYNRPDVFGSGVRRSQVE